MLRYTVYRILILLNVKWNFLKSDILIHIAHRMYKNNIVIIRCLGTSLLKFQVPSYLYLQQKPTLSQSDIDVSIMRQEST